MEITAKDRKALIILGAVAAVALLLFVFVLHKGGGSETASTAPGASEGTSAPAPAPSPSPTPGGSKPSSHEGDAQSSGADGSEDSTPTMSGRDPFQPLVSDSTGGDGTTAPLPAPVEPSPEPSSSPSPDTPTDTIHHAGHTVKLESIEDGKSATISIDGKEYVAKPGQVLAYDFKLTGIDGSCVDIAHVTHPFELCLPEKTA